MKKSKFLYSLPFKLLVSVALGMGFGLLLNFNSESAFTTAALNVIVTLKYILGQLINFCVPLIIIGFIAPSITQLGNNASRMLGIAVFIAYFSSLGAALFSTAAGYLLIPHLSIRSSADSLRSLPDVIFQLSIPQIMPVMSAGFCMDQSTADDFPAEGISEYCSFPGIPDPYSDPSSVHWTDLLFSGLRRNYYQTASCIPESYCHCITGSFYLAVSPVYCCRNLCQRKSSESYTPLWSRLSYCNRHHVLSSHPCRSTSVCWKS